MKPKVLIGSAMVAALMGLGVLVGSITGADGTSAQTSSPTPQATAQATPGATTPSTDAPVGPGGMRGGRGGHGGGDLGRGFGAATADAATRAITSTTTTIDLVNDDVAYASGKMDTTTVQRWVTEAEGLLDKAESANSNAQYGQAVAYAGAARELAMAARSQMAQELGAENLPSYSQLPQRGDKGAVPTGTTVTQAQASRIVAETYDRLLSTAGVVQRASNASEATPYLTEAQNAYKAAYDAYQAGNYTGAVISARLAGKLAHVANAVARASSAPANADTPVTVPSPNF